MVKKISKYGNTSPPPGQQVRRPEPWHLGSKGLAGGQGRRAHHTAMLNNDHPHTPYKSYGKNREGNKTSG